MEPTEQEVELEMTENQYWIDKYESLHRLEKNADFQSVILGGYFVDKAVNGVSMLSDEATKRDGKRGDLMETLVAISQLQDYFRTIKSLGCIAPDLDDEE